MKILVTGFDPFGGEPINPAIESVKRAAGNHRRSPDHKAGNSNGCASIAGGDSGSDPQGRPGHDSFDWPSRRPADITVERVGINVDDCRIADNAGNQPVDEPIYPDGPDAYFVTLPIKAMVKAMQEAGVPASVSTRPVPLCATM